jgi:hypothetical protein
MCLPPLAPFSLLRFKFLESMGLRTFFNDHPFPVAGPGLSLLTLFTRAADQTTAKEVAFRWEGLAKWLTNGITFW